MYRTGTKVGGEKCAESIIQKYDIGWLKGSYSEMSNRMVIHVEILKQLNINKLLV